MGKWVLYTQSNYARPKPTHLTPLRNLVTNGISQAWRSNDWNARKMQQVQMKI